MYCPFSAVTSPQNKTLATLISPENLCPRIHVIYNERPLQSSTKLSPINKPWLTLFSQLINHIGLYFTVVYACT
jgi:hypothetical protein